MRLKLHDWLDGLEGLTYFVAPNGEIIARGEQNWRLFAVENGVTSLANPASVAGRSIFDFIQGDEARGAYRDFFDALTRGDVNAVTFPFPCDTAKKNRDLRMAITPVRSDGELLGFILQAIDPKTAARLPDAVYETRDHGCTRSHKGAATAVCCSFCQRVASPNANLKDATAWAEAKPAASLPPETRVRHAVCPPCNRKWSDELLFRGSGKRLTQRQIEILQQLCRGDSNKTIARRLGMTENTVKSHVKEIFRRIGAKSRTEAVRLAYRTWPDLREA